MYLTSVFLKNQFIDSVASVYDASFANVSWSSWFIEKHHICMMYTCCTLSCRSQSHSGSFTLLKEFLSSSSPEPPLILSLNTSTMEMDSDPRSLLYGGHIPWVLGVTKMVPSIFWKYPPWVEVRVSLHLPRTVFPVDGKVILCGRQNL